MSSVEPSPTQKVTETADIIAIGFSNGFLLLYDTMKNDVVYKNPNFVKGKRTIDYLKVCTFQMRPADQRLPQSYQLNASMMSARGNQSSLAQRRNLQQQVTKSIVLFCLAEGHLSNYEVYPNLHVIDSCINDQRDVTHFESYFHARSLNQMLATANRCQG